jgi:predicted dehydrogenase
MQWALAHDAVVIAALCDVNEQNLGRSVKSVARIQGTEPVTVGDFQRLLEDPSIDAVMVATPHHWHCPIAVRALDAGKHVYLEKPASHVFQEGRRLVDAALRNNRIVQHGTQMRSSELTAAAAKVLSRGILGAIKMAKAWGVEPRSHHPNPVPDQSPPDWLNYPMWLGPAPQRPFNHNRFQRWNSYRDYGNGEIGGDGIHDIDLARWGLGVTTHPVRITAQGSRIHLKGESDYPDNMMVTYQYADDKVLIYENRNFAPYAMHGWDNGNMFCGTEGYMVFSRRGYFQTYLGSKEEPGPGQRGGAGNQEHVHNFFDGVRSGTQTNADAQVAHLSCALVHLGEIAYRTGRVLQFDPESETFPGNDEANAMLGKPYRTPWGFAES